MAKMISALIQQAHSTQTQILSVSHLYCNKINKYIYKHIPEQNAPWAILFSLDNIRNYDGYNYTISENDIIIKYLFDLFKINSVLFIVKKTQKHVKNRSTNLNTTDNLHTPEEIIDLDDLNNFEIYRTGTKCLSGLCNDKIVITSNEALYLLGFDAEKYEII